MEPTEDIAADLVAASTTAAVASAPPRGTEVQEDDEARGAKSAGLGA